MSTIEAVDPYRVQRVRDGVAEGQTLVARLTEFAKNITPDDTPHINALRRALTATIIHLDDMKRSRRPYKPSGELNTLWWQAADALQRDYPELADACRSKAFGWVDPVDWEIAEQEGKKISIQDMKDALKRLVGDHVANIEEQKALEPETTDVTRFMPAWMFEEKKTKAVTFLVGGLVLVICGAWAVLVFVSDKGSKADAGKQSGPPITINNSPTISPQMHQNITVTPPAASPPPDMRQVKFNVCVGENQARCPKNSRHIGCTDYAAYARKECERFSAELVNKPTDGGHCGYVTYEITCTAKMSAK